MAGRPCVVSNEAAVPRCGENRITTIGLLSLTQYVRQSRRFELFRSERGAQIDDGLFQRLRLCCVNQHDIGLGAFLMAVLC